VLIDDLREGRFPVALEITPPRTPTRHVLLRRAAMLGERTAAVNVIQRSDRQSSLDASIELALAGLSPVWHLVNRASTRGSVTDAIARARDAGVRCVLCIRGDHAAADSPDTPRIRDIVAMVRDTLPASLIGATMNQYLEQGAILRNLLPKLEAGAAYVQTQPVFEPARLLALAETLRDRSPETHVVAMAMPLHTAAAARRMEERLGISLGEPFLRRIEQGGESAGWAIFEETLAALRASPLVDGVAIMTLEMDPPEAFCERLRTAVAQALG
jgi:5,10-methylenetetrahydrofolate reductase